MDQNGTAARDGAGGLVRAPRDFAAGAFMVALGLFAFWQNAGLALGTLRAFGPGMMPAILSGLCVLFGLLIAGSAFLADGPALERWTLRGPLFVLGGAVAFGLTIRPLGLAVAAPLSVVVTSFAGRDARIGETLVFGVLITLLCLGLFKYALGLPIPVAPWLIGY
jgi:putative tricarboxylic transport membrane protein